MGSSGAIVVLSELTMKQRGEWPSGLNSVRQVTEVKLGRVRSDSGLVTTRLDLTTHLVVLRKGR